MVIRLRTIERTGVLLIAVVIAWFYSWTATSGPGRRASKIEGLDYYNLLVDGLREGHLYLKFDGTPGIENLKNPYDPKENGGYRQLDMSYYRAHYYIYFGPAPAVVLMLPWLLITGSHLPSNFATVIFATIGFWISLVLLLRLRRIHFPSATTGSVWLCSLLLGLATLMPPMLRRPAVYEVAIACSYLFVVLTLWSLHRALSDAVRRNFYLCLAGTSFGVAVAARPTNVFAFLIFLPIAVWFWKRRLNVRRLVDAGWLRSAASVLGPLGIILSAILLYNYFRFEDPFQFGQIYQLTSRDMVHSRTFSAAYIPFNLYLLFAAPAQHSEFFPFFLPGIFPQMPDGYDGYDDPYGIIPNVPIVVMALGALLGYQRGVREQRSVLGLFILILCIFFAAVTGVFLLFFGISIRYYVDILPPLIILVCIGIFSANTVIHNGFRRTVLLAVWALALTSILFSVCTSFQHAGLLRALNPPAWATIAKGFDFIPSVYDRIAGTHYGPIEITLEFPKNQTGKFQPLLVSGRFPEVDYVWALYSDENHIQFGFEHTNYGGGASQPILIDYSKVHVLRVEAGFLYPPAEHAYFRGMSPTSIAGLKNSIRILLDDIPYLEKEGTAFYDPVSRTIPFGINMVSDTFGKRFTGTTLNNVRVKPVPHLMPDVGYGPIEMAVIFPLNNSLQSEPLLVTGETGKGDLLYVTYVDARHIQFVMDHWGVGAVKSPLIEVVPGYVQVLDLSMGSLYSDQSVSMARRLAVRLNGIVVMDTVTDFYPASADKQTFGLNLIGGSVCGPRFTGKILNIKRKDTW